MLAAVGTMVLLLLAVCNDPCFAAEAQPVASRDGSFVDASRSREILYRLYYPRAMTGSYPIVIVSHGLGDSRTGNALLGRRLASQGYICIHLQHAGSDSAVYEGLRDRRAVQQALQAALRRPGNALNRFLDVPAAVRELERLNEQDQELKDHLDLGSLGMAGHSYGAISTMVAAGEGVGPRSRSIKVEGLRAALVLSPSPPSADQDLSAAYRRIDIPLFHMTGTRDASPPVAADRDIKPADRVKPYLSLTIPDQYLLILEDADHLTFAGNRIGTSEEEKKDKQHMEAVLSGAVGFFDAYLKRDGTRKAWLRTEFKQMLKAGDRFEFK